MLSFIHLRAHSDYSLLQGAIKTKDLIRLAVVNRMPALALTDTQNVFGSMEFCLEAAKQGIQPIVGCQILLKARSDDPRYQRIGVMSDSIMDPLIFLVQSEIGYQNLLKLVTKSFESRLHVQHDVIKKHQKSEKESDTVGDPYITWEIMQELSEGLIVLTAGWQGPIGQIILDGSFKYAKLITQRLHDIFQDRLYMEISRIGVPEEVQCEVEMIKLADQQKIDLVATNEIFFSDESMHEAHDVLLSVAQQTYVSIDDRRKSFENYYFKSQQEMISLFQDHPDALANTITIARRCAFMVETSKPMLPAFSTKRGEDKELTFQAKAGLKQRLKDQQIRQDTDNSISIDASQIKIYEQRLKYELDVIQGMGFAGYYLIVADFIKWAKSQNIPVGPGRGSGAGSLVAWALTITDVDPIRWNLLFERFLNPERVSMPDFDVDFCQDQRDRVIEYVRQKYGIDRVAQIVTLGKLQPRAVTRDVGRVLSHNLNVVDRIAKLIPMSPANPLTLTQAIEQTEDLKREIKDDDGIGHLLMIAQNLEGLYRHASTHAAGLVIGHKPLEEIVGLYYDGKSNVPATQCSMKYVELAGLVKFDFLGLKTLTVIQKTVDLLKNQNINVDITHIPLNDTNTFAMLQRAEVVGVFQLESAGMRDVIKKLKPTRFEELIALVALYRPGPMDDIPRYLGCKNGEMDVVYLHPLLEDILQETFGVMVYQEQVMQIAQKLAGYSLGQADLLRRAMGKKIQAEMDAQATVFIKGACQNGVPENIAKQIFDQAAKFAGYGFNKCHSAPYALIAYQTAYLKANYPVEFMAASMTYDKTNMDKLISYRSDLIRMQIDLLPPDINASTAEFSVEKTANGRLAVRYCLAALKQVGEDPIALVVHERIKNGPFKNMVDFASRLDSKVINRRLLENLIFAGAFDCFDRNRFKHYALLDALLPYAGLKLKKQQSVQTRLFSIDHTYKEQLDFDADRTYNVMCGCATNCDQDGWNKNHRLTCEFKAMGFYLSGHPLDDYRDMLKKRVITPGADLITYFQKHPNSTVNVAGIVIDVQKRLTWDKKPMAFIKLSDASGVFEVAIKDKVFETYHEDLKFESKWILKVNGEIKNDRFNLRATSVEMLTAQCSPEEETLTLGVSTVAILESLTSVFEKTPVGLGHVYLKIPISGKWVFMRLPKQYRIDKALKKNLSLVSGIELL